MLAQRLCWRYALSAAAVLLCLLLPLLMQGCWLEGVLRVALLLAAGALFAGCYLAKEARWEAESEALLNGQEVRVRGTVVQKEQKNGRWQLTLSLPGYENQVLVSVAEDGGYPLDCILLVEGTFKQFEEPRGEGQFNERSYYKSKEVIGRIYAETTQCVRQPSGIFAWRERLYALRESLGGVYEACLPDQEAGILSAMAAGEKALLDAQIKSLFQRAGISHILAISGMHISLIGMGLYRLLRKCRLPYAVCACVTAGILFLYGTMIGMSVSAKRAIGMFFIYMLAQCVGRGYDSLSALALLAMLLLFFNPFLLQNVSFQFSFAAVLAVVTINDVLASAEEQGRLARAARAVAAGLLLQLFTLPLVAYYYYELPLYALFLNLLLLPYLGAALGFGLLGGAVGLCCLPLARVLLFPCHLVLSVYVWVCGAAGELPFSAVICGQPAEAKLWVYYALLAVLFALLRRRRLREAREREERDEVEEAATEETQAAGMAGRRAPFGRRLGRGLLLPAYAAVLLLLLCHVPSGGFEIDYLDVGQGDGSMLRTENGVVCFVDGGSSDVSSVGTYRILPFLKAKGIRRVDYWFLSHLDEDHVSGFYEVLESGYEIGTVVLAAEMPEDSASEQLRAELEQYQVPAVTVSGGDIMQLSPSGGARIRFLSPDETTPFSDANGASLVFVYEDERLRALWTGDIGTQQEEWLLSCGALSGIDVYKAAHHGSRYSNSEAFLQALSPQLSVVSCSATNRYGHPSAEAVENMTACGSRILYTMEGGRVKLSFDGDELVAETFLGGG